MSMKTTTILLCTALLSVCCGPRAAQGKRESGSARQAAQAPAPKEYTYRIRAEYSHPTDAYTQGLFFADGLLWEGTGQHGASVVRKTDLKTGRSDIFARLPRSDFGEGIALLDGKLYQLTWQSNKAYVYDAATGKKLREHRYPGEGWGLTTDGQKLYMTDGSATIFTIDPETFRRERRTTVTYRGQPVHYLNELEWIDGKIWANVYMTDQIVILDPATGLVEAVVDLTGLLTEADYGPQTDVLNGIAYDAAAKRIFVTGKNWPKLFEIEMLEK